jgi:hypothetical protein
VFELHWGKDDPHTPLMVQDALVRAAWSFFRVAGFSVTTAHERERDWIFRCAAKHAVGLLELPRHNVESTSLRVHPHTKTKSEEQGETRNVLVLPWSLMAIWLIATRDSE